MKKFLLTVILVLTGIFGYSQTVIVLDAQTQSPISEVTIYLKKGKKIGSTDIKGKSESLSFSSKDSLVFVKEEYRQLLISAEDLGNRKYLVYMNKQDITLNNVIISASKFEEKQRDLPRQVQVISRQDVAFMNQPTTAEMLSSQGQIFVQKSQLGGGSPVLRGFEANKVLMVVDGIRLNNAIYRAGHLQNVLTMDQNNLEKTEVIFGPGSVIYGSDALGGVMHFHTRNPDLAKEGTTLVKSGAFFRYGSAAHEVTGHADVMISGSKLGSFTSFTASTFDDLRAGNNKNLFYGDFGKRLWYAERINGKDSMIVNSDPNKQVGSAYNQFDFLEKLLYKQNEHISHTLNFQFSNTNDIPRYDRLTEMSNGKPRFAEWYYGPQKRILAAYAFNYSGETKLFDQNKTTISFQNIGESRVNRRFNSLDKTTNTENVNVFGINTDFTKEVGRNEIRYGAEFYYNDVKSTAETKNINTEVATPATTRYPDGGNKMINTAAYINHTMEIKPWLIMNDGIRFNYISLQSEFKDKTFFPFPYSSINQNYPAVNGSLGFVFLPDSTWKISVNGSSGFRAPNLDDMTKVFASVPGSLVVPNPEIKPEYVYSVEASIAKVKEGKYKIEATGWYSWYQNALTLDNSTFMGNDSVYYDGQMSNVLSLVNKASAYVTGFSVQGKVNLNPYVSLTSGITYTYGRIQTDTTPYPLDHIPPVYGRTGIMYENNKLTAEVFSLYNGWKNLKDYNIIGEDNFAYATIHGMPGWATLNARAAYKIRKEVQIQMSLENILDSHYRTFSSGISAPGRNFLVTLRTQF